MNLFFTFSAARIPKDYGEALRPMFECLSTDTNISKLFFIRDFSDGRMYNPLVDELSHFFVEFAREPFPCLLLLDIGVQLGMLTGCEQSAACLGRLQGIIRSTGGPMHLKNLQCGRREIWLFVSCSVVVLGFVFVKQELLMAVD